MKNEKLFLAFGEIDDELIQGANKRRMENEKTRKKFVMKWGSLAAYFIFMLVLAIFLNSNKTGMQISVNMIKEEMISCSPKYFDPNTHYKEEWTTKQFAEYFGRDYSLLQLPLGLEYSESIRNEVVFNDNDSIVMDRITFEYESNEEIYAFIMVSKLESPGTTLYQFEQEKLKASKIKGKEIIIGGHILEKNPEVFELIYTDFNQNTKNYRIEARNVTLKDFKDILEVVIE